MKEQDNQMWHVLSRREALALMGTAGAGLLVGGWTFKAQTITGAPRSLCIVRPEQTEGPYFVDERLNRFDIRVDPTSGRTTPGTPLALTLQVMRLSEGDCRPLAGAQVDIWQCDAVGVYSDVKDPGFNTLGQKFLRGYQVTDAQGEARFLTIYPGWYPIRTVHIHFKVRTDQIVRRSFEFTSQLYFLDELTDQVHLAPPYSSRERRRVRNRHDFIFRDGGDQLMLEPFPANGGYAAIFPIGLEFP